MVTESPGKFPGPKNDIVLFYRSIPFGWNGAPAFFAAFGDDTARIHRASGTGLPLWNSRHSFTSRLYVDDGISVELMNRQRQEDAIRLWERVTTGLLGPQVLNQSKMEEEGQWPTSHIILGLWYNTESLTVAIPEATRAGARVLFDSILADRGAARLGATSLQQIRGWAEHFKSTNAIWRLLTSPVGNLLTYGDEIGGWISCPVEEFRRNFRRPMYAVDGFMTSETDRKQLSKGNMSRLLTPAGRLSLKCETGSFIRFSADATLERVGGISWHGRQFPRAGISDVAQILGAYPKTEWGIGSCEMMGAFVAITIWHSNRK